MKVMSCKIYLTYVNEIIVNKINSVINKIIASNS